MKKISLYTIMLSSFMILSSFIMNHRESKFTKESDLERGNEFAKLFGNVLKDNANRDYIIQSLLKVDAGYGEELSFAYLINNSKLVKLNEMGLTADLKSTENLKKTISNQLMNEGENYKYLNSEFSKEVDKGSAILNALANEKMQIIFNFEDKKIDLSNGYYVCFAQHNEVVTTNGYFFMPKTNEYKSVNKIDSEFVYKYPTFIIIPIDESDLQDNKIEVIKSFPDKLIQRSGGVSKTVTANSKALSTSPQAVLLTQNMDHNLIPQEDIIYSRIPRIKVKGTDWIGFLGNKVKLDLWRGVINEDSSPTYNESNGQITAPTLPRYLGNFEIRKKDCKDKKWVFVNIEFDPDWNMSENAQDFSAFTKHNLVGSASFTLKGTAGFKKDGNTIKPHFEASGSTTVDLTVGGARFRAHQEISRRQILSSIVGAAPTGASVTFDGVNWNVKTLGKVDYYFMHYHTDLSN
jgi:hypothetical protein